MSLAQRIRELRRQKEISQTKLGKMTGLHYTQIGRYERGTSIPSSDALLRLAEALQVSTDYLVEGSTEDVAKTHIHDRELLRQFEQVEQLDNEDKAVIKTLIDAFLTKRKLQEMVR